jgi:hypothetical protein
MVKEKFGDCPGSWIEEDAMSLNQLTTSLETSKKAIHQFIDNIRSHPSGSSSRRKKPFRRSRPTGDQNLEYGIEDNYSDQEIENGAFESFRLVDILDDEFKEQYPFPSILLGLCEDRVPLILDLTNPAPGSILIISDAHSGKTNFLRSLLDSAIMLNKEHRVTMHLIVDDQQDFYSISDQRHCVDLLPNSDQGVGLLIKKLNQVIDSHKSTPSESVKILAIDDLAQLLEKSDERTSEGLIRLIRHGARLGVWVIGTLSTRDLRNIEQVAVDSFRTKIIGQVNDRSFLGNLAGGIDPQNLEFKSGNQFSIMSGSEWIKIFACE